jgi:hypothetical protein
MSDQRCGTCENYQAPSDPDGQGYGYCLRIPFGWDEDLRCIDDLAIVTDSEQYHADLLCKPDFGCVLWEPKSPTADPAAD